MTIASLLVILVILVGCAPKRPAYLQTLQVLHANELGTLVKGKCSICTRHGLKSTVTLGSQHCISPECGPAFYDQKGKYHSAPPCKSGCSQDAWCSRGHRIQIPSPGSAAPATVPTGTISPAGPPVIGPPR